MERSYEIPCLTGEHVSLRPITLAESLLVHEWIQESDILTETCRPPVMRAQEEVAERHRQRKASSLRGTLAIILRGTDTLAGQVSYFDLNFRNRSAEIGYIVAPSARGKGIAREAVRLLSGYLFDGLGLNKVYAQTAAFNTPSVRLLESLGFHRDAVLREHHLYQGKLHDAYVYSLLARERPARKQS